MISVMDYFGKMGKFKDCLFVSLLFVLFVDIHVVGAGEMWW